MKLKSLGFLALLAAVCMPMAAQQNQEAKLDSLTHEVDQLVNERNQQRKDAERNAIWGKTRQLSIGWVSDQLSIEEGIKLDSKLGVSLRFGNTYWLTKPMANNILRIGLDAVWFDFTYNRYKDQQDESGDYGDGFGDDGYGDDGYGDGYGDDDYGDGEGDGKIKSHRINIGLGLGPNITVAPFANSANRLKYLRASLYFHFVPSYTAFLQKYGDGGNEVSHGFTPAFGFGGAIQYRRLSLGFEGKWGTTKFNTGDDEADDYDYDYDQDYAGGTADKIKFKSSSFRIFLSYRF